MNKEGYSETIYHHIKDETDELAIEEVRAFARSHRDVVRITVWHRWRILIETNTG